MDLERHRAEARSLFIERQYSKAEVLLATEVTEKARQHLHKPNGPLRINGARQGRPMRFKRL